MTIRGDRTKYEGPWLEMCERSYVDRHGKERTWDFARRRGNQPASVVIARTEGSNSLILVLQTRVPIGGKVLEFPAGLVEPGEDPGTAGMRELTEETGYVGRINRVLPGSASSAGLTDELIHVVIATIEEYASEMTDHSESEDIEVIRVPPDGVEALLQRAARESWTLDAKLAVYLDSMMAMTSSG